MSGGERADGQRLEQPVAAVSPEDVERLARREFGDDSAEAVMAMREELGSYRVRAAVLKLAGGDLMTLREQVGEAGADVRDVLAAAEYRRYCALPPDATEDEKRAAIEEDAARYRVWFEGA